MKWTRQSDGSYTSEAGRVFRFHRVGYPKSSDYWAYQVRLPNSLMGGGKSLADAKARCEKEMAEYLDAINDTPPDARTLLNQFIARADRRSAINSQLGGVSEYDSIAAACIAWVSRQMTVPQSVANALEEQWRKQQQEKRRRLALP